MKSAYDEAVRLLPSKTAAALGERFKTAEEFRLRAGRYPCALIGGREEAIADRAVTRDDIACVLEKATNASLHAVWQDMSKGFISCGFGLRIGVCGTGVISGGKLTGLRDISSVSIRIGGSSSQSVSSQTDEQRLAAVLQRCDGVGNVTALLSETGAVIVCDGADDAAVRLSVIKAVEAFTGFSSDSIQVIKTAPNIGG